MLESDLILVIAGNWGGIGDADAGIQ
jgi:hypothetical protein